MSVPKRRGRQRAPWVLLLPHLWWGPQGCLAPIPGLLPTGAREASGQSCRGVIEGSAILAIFLVTHLDSDEHIKVNSEFLNLPLVAIATLDQVTLAWGAVLCPVGC